MLQRYNSDLTVFKMAAYNYSLDRSLSRVSKGHRANNCHGPRLAFLSGTALIFSTCVTDDVDLCTCVGHDHSSPEI